MRSEAQERAAKIFIESVDKVIVSPPNEQNNVLYVLLDQHHPRAGEAGVEMAKMMIDPTGFVLWATYEPGYGEEFNVIFDDYVDTVGIPHPTGYGQ